MNRPLNNITNVSRLSMGPARKGAVAGQQQQGNNRQSSIGASRGPSLGPRGSVVPNPRTSSIGSRPSTGTGGSRKSYDGRKSGGPVKDTRSISDKEYQKSAIRNIVEYLTGNGYSKPISHKTISSPSTRDFLSVLEFLFQRYENNSVFKIGTKPEEFTNDVIYIFNFIGYPFPLQKSNISTVGAQHAWPAFLAALDWFVILLKSGEESSVPDDLANGIGEMAFFDYCCKSYNNFLSGDDTFNLFEEELAKDFESKNSIIETDIASMNAVKSEVVAELDVFANEPDRIASLESKKAILTADVQKFSTLSEKLDGHKQLQIKKMHETEKECELRRKELAVASEEKAQHEAVVAQQAEKSVDAAKINKERTILEEALNKAIKAKEQANQKNWDEEMANHRKVEEITKLLALYENLATSLLLIGPNQKFANGVDYKVPFTGVSSETQVCSVLKEIVRPGLLHLKEELVSRILQSMDEMNTLDMQFRSLEEETTEKKEQISSEETKHTKLEALYQKEKEKWVAVVKQVEMEIELVSKHIDRVKAETANELGKSQKAVENATLERDELAKQLEQQRKEMNDSVLRTVDILAQHKEFIHKRLQEVLAHHRNLL